MALMFHTITMGGDLHTAVAEYYDTPIIRYVIRMCSFQSSSLVSSIRNTLLPHILRSTQLNHSDDSLEHYCFGHDIYDGLDLRHVGKNGHRILADFLSSFTSRVACEGWREDQLVGTLSGDSNVFGGWDWNPSDDDRVVELLQAFLIPTKAKTYPNTSLVNAFLVYTIVLPLSSPQHFSAVQPKPSLVWRRFRLEHTYWKYCRRRIRLEGLMHS
ncbi:hypothetical protein J3R30DRAFT_3530594 [Lentinula aciculospora]|uniref:Uncharacterized protein n=1 Tax=Lentinula aciculospora TaxID=153920 RepID=A0A9W8ZZA3_9AGAR|nr:hypothetical protein J3R30DRAFT_3530594 [Lentinula aciculospora]